MRATVNGQMHQNASLFFPERRGKLVLVMSSFIAIATFMVFTVSVSVSLRAQELARQSPWPDTPLTRLEAYALLQAFNVELLTNESATFTLDRWCERHFPSAPHVVAELVQGEDKAADLEQRKLLEVAEAEPLKFRRVRLRCGEHVLSEADNWYVPSRLKPEMNEALNTSNIAFGRAVQALHFRRQRLSTKLLWSPLPEGWDTGSKIDGAQGASLTIPPYVLRHHALLRLPDGTPFSEVVETYTNEVLNFDPPFKQ